MGRSEIESALVKEYLASGREKELGTASYEAELTKRFVAAGVATPEEKNNPAQVKAAAASAKAAIERRRAGRNAMRAGVQAGAFTPEAFQEHLRGKIFSGELTPREEQSYLSEASRLEGRRARQEQAQGKRAQTQAVQGENRQARDESWYANDQRRAAQEERRSTPQDAYEAFHAKRAAILRAKQNEYLGDERKNKLGTVEFAKDLHQEYKKAGVAQKGDAVRPGTFPINVLLARTALQQAATSGREEGAAVGSVAQGLNRAVVGASGAFLHVGETALGFVLAPFGKSGAAMSGIGRSLGDSLLASLSAGGAFVTAGLKVGSSLAAGILNGVGLGLAGGIGAAIGAAVGIGPAAGLSLGLGLGASIGTAIGGLIGQFGGAVGQALNAVGQAFGQVGKGIGDIIGNVQAVLSDLVQTGKRYSGAALTLSRSGLSLQASGGVTALAQTLTGSPSGLNDVYSGFGNMPRYRGHLLQAFGVAGATGKDPLQDTVKAAEVYRKLGSQPMGDVRREIMLQGAFAGNPGIGNLFSMNALQPGFAAQMAQKAQKAAPTPEQTIADAKLTLDLQGVQTQLDSLKIKFLSDLMPGINLGLSALQKYFAKNEAVIIKTLQGIGTFMVTQFPSMLVQGMNALFTFGKYFTAQFPKIFTFALDVLTAGIGAIQKIAGELAGPVGMLSPTAGKALTAFAGLNLDPHLLGMSKDGQNLHAQANALRGGAKDLADAHSWGGKSDFDDPDKVKDMQDRVTNKNRNDGSGRAEKFMADYAQYQKLKAQADKLDKKAGGFGLQGVVDKASGNANTWLNQQQVAANKSLASGILGPHAAGTAQNWLKTHPGQVGQFEKYGGDRTAAAQRVEVHVKTSFDPLAVDVNTDEMHRKTAVLKGRQAVFAEQRTN